MDTKGSTPLNNLLSKELTRKEFILVLSTALLSLTGIPSFLGVLTRQTNTAPDVNGFGSGHFGGNDVKPIN